MSFLAIISSWLSLSVSFYKLFEIPSKTVTPESKKALSAWILKLEGEKIRTERLIDSFISLFDNLFGKKKFSFPFIMRSIVASYFSIWIAFVVLAAYDYSIFEDQILWIYLLQLPIVFNLLPDYLSLIETRQMLQLMKRFNSTFSCSMILIIDFCFTLLIFLIFSGLFLLVIDLFSGRYLFNQINLNELKQADYGSLGDPNDLLRSPFFIYFISTFFTSIWIWVFILSVSILRVFNKSIQSFTFLKRNLDIEHKPWKSIGAFSVVLITALHAIYAIKLIFDQSF